MKLIHTNGRFEAHCSFEEKDIAKSAGFKWEATRKVWYTTDPQHALLLKEYADTECLQELANVAVKVQAAIEASHAANSDLTVPAPAGLDYLAYQKAGIEFALSKRSCLIADEMGLGKTMQALGTINACESAHNVLIIVPAALRLNWFNEAKKWIIRPLSINRGVEQIVNGITIVGYEEAVKHIAVLEATNWDIVICDEAHYLKNGKAKRTRAILGGKDSVGLNTRKWVFLTGTPILNKPVELWTLVKKLDPNGLGSNWVAFVKRYCAAVQGRWGWEVDGASNLDELNQKLRIAGMIRRTKAGVLPDLPAKRRTLLPFVPSTAAKKIIAAQKKEQLAAKKALRKAKSLERKDKALFAKDIETLRADADVAFKDVARMRHELALLKVPQVVEVVQNAAESSPVIVFGHHKDVVQGIADGLTDLRVATITGDHSTEQRQATVELFQAGKLDAVICSIKAAGVGLTMTRSSHVIFAELDWTPGWMQQAEDRAHRIGQKNSVQVDWLVLDDSLEAKMAKTLMAKMAITSAATGDDSPTEDSSATVVTPSATTPAPAFTITADDLARAKENEAKEEAKLKAKQAAQAEDAKIRREVKAGRYVVEIDGKVKSINLKLSGKGNFYIKHGEGEISFHEGDKAAKILAALTPDQRLSAQREYGKVTGNCCKCGQLLNDPLSIALGIGPDCGAAEHAAYLAAKNGDTDFQKEAA